MPKPSSPESRKPKTEKAVDYKPRAEGDFTAPSHRDSDPTKVISVVANGTEVQPVDGEQAVISEFTPEEREDIEKAIGSGALESLTAEDIATIKSSSKHREMLNYLFDNKVGDRIESSPLLQKMVSDWVKFGVRAEELPDDSEYIQYEDDDDDEVTDEHSPVKRPRQTAKQRIGEAGSAIGANAFAVQTGLGIARQEGKAKRLSKKQKRIATARAKAEAEFSDDQEGLEKAYAKIEKRENLWLLTKVGAAAVVGTATVLTSYYFLHKYGSTPSGGGNHHQPGTGSGGDIQPGSGSGTDALPRPNFPGTEIPIPQTPEEMKHFFDTATDTAQLTPNNDFNLPIANGNNPTQFKIDLFQQLRGNSHELASYLSVVKIPGAPLEADFASKADYIRAINDYAVQLDKNPTEHFQKLIELSDKVNAAEFHVRDIQANYESTLIDQAGQFDIDNFVPKNGTVTEVIFNKGTPDEFSILVRNECGQTIKELIEQHFAQPVPQAHTSYYTAPAPHPTYVAPVEYTPPAPAPRPAPVPVPQPQGGGGGGGHNNLPPSTWGKNTRADGSNLAQYGDAPRGSGAPQNEQNVVTPSANYSPNAGNDNPGGLAPGASPSTGLFNGGQEAATPGLNGTPPSSPSSGAESAGGSGGAGASENTSSVGQDS